MKNHRSSPRGPDSIDIDTLRPPFAPTDAAVEWLFRLQRLGIRPGLDAIRELLEAMGRPDRAFPCVVIAGTNGKGGAATALAAFCRAAGLRTGLYTSPHLLDVRERIVVDGEPIPTQELFGLVSRHRSRIESTRTTFFESTTALALDHFARCQVDVAVLEAGLGGRLDATNAVRKEAVVLTSIGRDHEELLGGSLESIAREKLGLAVADVPFYLHDLDDPAIQALAERVLDRVGAQRVGVGELADLMTDDGDLRGLDTDGTLQRSQVRSMLAVYRDLHRRMRWPETVLDRALPGLRLPGRYEAWGRDPRLVLDTAHNESALRTTLHQWRDESSRATRVLVFGASQGKSIDGVFGDLAASARTVLVTSPHWYRARPAPELATAIRRAADERGLEVEIVVEGTVRATLEEARRRARSMSPAGPAPSILVLGSHFLVAEALDRLGVDDLWQQDRTPLWDAGLPLRQRPAGSTEAVI